MEIQKEDAFQKPNPKEYMCTPEDDYSILLKHFPKTTTPVVFPRHSDLGSWKNQSRSIPFRAEAFSKQPGG